MARPPLPPFTEATAIQKVRMAEDAWNTHDPERVAGAYTEDSAVGAIAPSSFRDARRSSHSCGANGHANSTTG
jgi:nuclear transport factor 2 (NTF2) superfamily protein